MREQILDYSSISLKEEEREFFESVNYDYNMIMLPIFAVDRRVPERMGKTYVFSEEQYLRVVPSSDPQLISNKILQEFDERIFSAILRIAEYQKNKEVITDYFTLAKIAGVDYHRFLERMRDSIQRLFSCHVSFQGLFGSISLLSSTLIFTTSNKNDFSYYDFPIDDGILKERVMQYVKDKKRLKHLLVLQLNDFFYSNVQRGEFISVKKDFIFSLTAVERKLFLMLLQQRTNPAFTKSFSCIFLASRIPLSCKTSSHIAHSVDTIQNAAETLKKRGLISGYTLTRRKPLKHSSIDFIML